MNVDEPEILKSNGEYLFYYADAGYNSQNNYISIIKTPKKADLTDAEIVKKIKIPTALSNIQLFLQDQQLIILGSKRSETESLLGRGRTVAIVYDISDMEQLVLKKLVEVNGGYQDARIVNNELYLVSNVSLNWYHIAYDVTGIVFNDLLPSATEIHLTDGISSTQQPIVLGTGTSLAFYTKTKIPLPCNQIFYLFPSEETLKERQLYPNFTLISKLSLSNLDKKLDQSLVFGSVQDVHMSENALYLPSSLYFSSPRTCLGCRRRTYNAGENTLVHKFTLGNKISYQTSLIIPGAPLNQYAMDEDEQENFRILTKTYAPNLATHFFVFDKEFKVAGQLLNIEPGEEFKSSRYIGDTLYLVTFQQIDPLFVVDIADITKPKIIGELKIPGFSTYLHPYTAASQGIQYLIGLGYSVKDNGRGGQTTDNVKVDLYKIDYTSKETAQTKCSALSATSKEYASCVEEVNTGNIAVSLVSSHEFTGQRSSSPALTNPRTFVRNSAKKLLLLPLLSYGSGYSTPSFAGLKGITIPPEGSMKEEISQNYIQLATQNNTFHNANQARVGYIGEVNYYLLPTFAGFNSGNMRIELTK